ncbi:tol-pal system YbgF family protein [Streptomyces triculaminicus]|uniref:tol-pal system YbgF family protein n=1 Tax=Streptomyces triculaminicus TaxID=2816232 RepID=UPI0037CE9AEB
MTHAHGTAPHPVPAAGPEISGGPAYLMRLATEADHLPSQALGRFTEARATLVRAEDPHDAARALAWLGRAQALNSDFPAAIDSGRQAVAEFTQSGSDRWVARSTEMLGQSTEQRSGDAARHLYARALRLYEPTSDTAAARVRQRLENLR